VVFQCSACLKASKAFWLLFVLSRSESQFEASGNMRLIAPGQPVVAPSNVILISLYVLEFSALLTAMAIYKKGERPIQIFLASSAGFVFTFAILASVTSTIVIIYLFRNRVRRQTKQFAMTLILNLWTAILAIGSAEAVMRVFAISTPAGPIFANTLLLPRSWEGVAARNRAILAKASTQGSYLIWDNELGWTIGPSRHSKDYNRELVTHLLSQVQRRSPQSIADYQGRLQRVKMDSEDDIYLSSVEGIRSPRVGMSFSGVPASHRIAILGDSFTFGLEVRYEDTWGHQLELALGQGYQVLNFGVDGYGVDQAYLRYERDILSWKPDIVILGVIDDDLRRTMGVYGFLTFPGGEIPFPKPRFITKGQKLSLLNLPLPTPEFLFAKKSITELPFVEYDGSYQRTEWESRFYHYSYSVRFLLSKYPRWPIPRPTVTDEALKSVNGEIFRSFVRRAREQGSTPIVAVFPSDADFTTDSRDRVSIATEVLRASAVPYLDMTACVRKVSPSERFVTLHYSPATNATIAMCLRDSIRQVSRG
jgi:hypothetical protein